MASLFIASLGLPALSSTQTSNTADSLSIFFLGDGGRHQPSLRAQELIPLMANRRIGVTYTESLGDLNAENLVKYDGLIIYADQVKIDSAQEKALLDFVNAGKGLIAIHSASYCFPRSSRYVALLGAQFKYHSTGSFRARTVGTDHPITRGEPEFETWDETYVHTKPNQDCVVLQVRREGDSDEPVTWVRTQGKGRVFYTAYGHDERTWNNSGFQSLIERAIRWSCGRPAP